MPSLSKIDPFQGSKGLPEEPEPAKPSLEAIDPFAQDEMPSLRANTAERSFWEKATQFFEDPQKEAAKATIDLVNAEMLAIQPAEARLAHEEIEKKKKAYLDFLAKEKAGQALFVRPIKAVGKVLAKGYYKVPLALDQLIAWSGGIISDAAESSRFWSERFFEMQDLDAFENLYQVNDDFLYFVSDMGKSAQKWGLDRAAINRAAMENELFALPPEKRMSLWDNPNLLLDPEWMVNNVGEAATSAVPAIAATIWGGPAGGMIVGGAMEGGDLYERLLAEGVDDETARMASASFGTVVGILNQIGIDEILKGVPTDKILLKLARATTTGAVEATTEFMEEPFEAAFEGFAKGKNKDEIAEDVIQSLKNIDVIPGSFLFGGGAAMVTGAEAAEPVEPAPQPAAEPAEPALEVEARPPEEVLPEIEDAEIDELLAVPDEELEAKIDEAISRQLEEIEEQPAFDELIGQVAEIVPETETEAFGAIFEARARSIGLSADEYIELHGLELERKEGEPASKASITFTEDNRTIISAFEEADISSLTHELGHVFRRDLGGQDLKVAEDFAGVQEGNWTVENEEKFAQAFERYLAEGEAPTQGLRKVFEQFKTWLTEIYRGIVGSDIDIELTPEIKGLFDSMLAEVDPSLTREVEIIPDVTTEVGTPTETLFQKKTPRRVEESVKTRVRRITGQARGLEAPTIKEREALRASLKKAEQAAKAAERAEKARAKREPILKERPTKTAIREVTGQARGLEAPTVTEREALKASLKKSAQAARAAAREGRAEGVAQERARMKELLARAKQRKEQTQNRNKLRAQIKKELKTTKVKRQAGKPKGKFTAEIQDVLDQMRTIINLSKAEAEERIMKNLEQYIDEVPPDDIVLENQLLMIASKVDDEFISIDELQGLLDEIKDLKEEGSLNRFVQLFERKEQDQKNRDIALDVITGGKGLPEDIRRVGEAFYAPRTRREALARFLPSIGKKIVGWPDMLDILSFADKRSKPFESPLNKMAEVLDENNAEKIGIMNNMLAIRQMYLDAFGLKSDRQMFEKMKAEKEVVDLGAVAGRDDIQVPLRFSKAQARKRYMEIMDQSLWRTFEETHAYNENVVVTIRNFLNEQDFDFISKQMEFYQEYYDSINEIYSLLYGVNLPRNENYSPIKREGVAAKEDDVPGGDFIQEMSFRPSAATAGSLKSRVENIRPIAVMSDLQVMERHIAEMEHFKAWANKIRELNAIFKDAEVRTAIKLQHNKDTLAVVDKFISDMARGGAENSYNVNWLDKLRANLTKAALGIQPDIMIKQLMSFPAYAEDMPITSFMEGVHDFALNPKEAIETLGKTDLMQARGANIERDMKTVTSAKEFELFRENPSFSNMLMMNVKLGDRGAVYVGGWAHYKNSIKNGLSHDEAIREFERATERSQQSGNLSDQSEWQRAGSFAKLFTMFLSTPNQYMRKELSVFRNLAAGRISKQQALKTLAIYHFLLPMLFQFASDRFTWDEDEQLRAIILGPLNGIFIVGDGLDFLLRTALDMRPYNLEVPVVSVVHDVAKGIKFLKDDSISAEDFMRALRALAAVVGIGTGLPLKSAVDISTGVSDTLQGDYEKGITEILGFSPAQAERIAKEK